MNLPTQFSLKNINFFQRSLCRYKLIIAKYSTTKQFSLDTVQKIAKALEIDVKDLFNKLD